MVFVLICAGVRRAEVLNQERMLLVVRSHEQYVCAPDANRSPAVVLLHRAEAP